VTDTHNPARGRPRDAAIADGVLDAALAELAGKGYAAFSLTAVAHAAGTTRPALYRRWKDKTALLVDAVARLAATEPPPVTGDPFTDLVAELENFRHCISEAGALPLAGLMLGEDIDPSVRATYLDQVVAPRRARIRGILQMGIDSGALAEDADLEVVTTFLTGSWYAYHLANRPAPRDWPHRVATLVWSACAKPAARTARQH
jgi:AcrR family transcriptional regulator